METEKTGRYFKYAIGEIILVVIGILIALQINNWNEHRKNRTEEQALLTQLRSEFQSNLEQLNQKIDIREDMIKASLTLLDYVDHPQKRDNDSILKHLSVTLQSPTFDPIINEISNSGRIQLLQNKRLKELLSRWTSEIIQVTEEELSWKDYSSTKYLDLFLDYSSLRSVLSLFWENNVLGGFHLDEGTTEALNLKKSITNNDTSLLFSDPKFEDHLAYCATLAKITNSQSVSLRNRITEILEIIEQELQ